MLGRVLTAIGRARNGQGRLSLLALAAFVAGVVMIVIAVRAQQRAPEPAGNVYGAVTRSEQPSWARDGGSRPASGDHRANQEPTGAKSHQLSLTASEPIDIDISAIGVHSAIFPIGKDNIGGLAVPQPGPNLNKVAWYENSPTPGQIGPAVLEGHLDTDQGRSVFFRLGALKPGQKVSITRADKTVAVFTIDGVRAYLSHAEFPTDLVYGGDLTRPTLRLITCSNFSHSTGHYVGNIIVFAHLSAVHR